LQKLVVRGGARLVGEVRVAGAKNAALPLLASSLLASGRSLFRGLPECGDVEVMMRVLADMGASVTPARDELVVVDTEKVARPTVSHERVRSLRASVLALGPLLARFGRATVSLPGGSELGARPIDQHLQGLAAMGADITLSHGEIVAEARRLRGAAIVFDTVTVTGTENLLMAASLAKGRTTLENAAREPEVEELAHVLNKMGARIQGAGTHVIDVEGVEELAPVEHTLMPDRIEAGTFLAAAALTQGDVLVHGAEPEHLDAVLAQLRASGAEVMVEDGGIRVRGPADFRSVDISTQVFPGFPTDLQAPLMVLMTRAKGLSAVHETIFENRFLHVPELQRMGADIRVEGRRAVVRGPTRLMGTQVLARDLRGAAALVLAGLVAQGTTEVLGLEHLDRGYHRLDSKLKALGADIRRAKGTS